MIIVVESECIGYSLVFVGEKWLLELVAMSDVVWPIIRTMSEARRIWLMAIVGGLLMVVVVELLEMVVRVPKKLCSD